MYFLLIILMDLTDLEITVLKVMHSRRLYGAKHIRLEKVMKSGFMPHQYGDVKKVIHNLVKRSLIRYAKRSKKAIQLNKEFLSEILEAVKK